MILRPPFALPTGSALALAALLLALSPTLAHAALTPEQEVAQIAQKLRPIPDDEWKSIAGEKIDQRYDVAKGDTLSDISLRLFGDARYWPKIWALNNDRITNPHIIRPGYQVAFVTGTGSSLPGVSVEPNGQASATSTAGSDETPAALREDWSKVPSALSDQLRDAPRSAEWKNLPRQSWEHVPAEPSADVDAQGFDRKNRMKIRVSTGFELEAIAASEKVDALGKITGSRSESANLVTGDAVFIVADGELQIGATYSVTSSPAVLKSRKSTRTGYSYSVDGEVKIIGVKEGLFVGTITKAKYFLNRGAMLIPKVARVPSLKPVPGPTPLEGVVIFDRRFGTYAAAQGKSIFIDRGTDDGVQPGMVFRSYRYHDPVNEKRVTDADFIIDADVMVTYSSPQFSVATVLRGFAPIPENAMVVLLTDISDLNNLSGFRNRSGEELQRDKELDDLDRLDGRPLTEEERRELEQLENWKKNPPNGEAAPDAGAAPPPAEGDAPLDPATAPPPPADGEAPAAGADPLDSSAAPPPPAEGDAIDAGAPPPPPPAEDVGADPFDAAGAATAPPPAGDSDVLDPNALPPAAPMEELAPPPPPAE